MSNGLGIIRDALSHGLANAAAAQAGAKFCFRTPIRAAIILTLHWKLKFSLFAHPLCSLFYKFVFFYSTQIVVCDY